MGGGGDAKVWRGDIEEYMHPDQPEAVMMVGGEMEGLYGQEQLVRRHEGERGGWEGGDPSKRGGGDSEYYEYNKQPQVCILYCPSFLSVCLT